MISASLGLGILGGTDLADPSVQIATSERDAAAETFARKDDVDAGKATTGEPSELTETDQAEASPEVTIAPPPPPEPEEIVRTAKVRKGDTLMSVLVREGVAREDANRAIYALSKNFNMRKLRAGQDVELRFDPADEEHLIGLSLKPDVERVVLATRQKDGSFLSEIEEVTLVGTMIRAGGRIDDSLYMAMDRADVPHDVIVNLINVFSWDVDFQREIRVGDRFEVYFEHFRDEQGRSIKSGHILYGSLTLSGKEIDLYRYTPSDDKRADYFDETGQSVRKALLRTPIDGARLTSKFGKRRHPILGYTKMHKGDDFGAPRGTPVKAAGDGVIERASRFGGYGKYIRIRHNGTYKTAYAHLNGYAKGIRAGTRVRQGQIIGYVGSTGRSTGPHLHYEVHKDGNQVNPRGIKLPTGRKLDGEHLADFLTMRESRIAEIEATPLITQIAASE